MSLRRTGSHQLSNAIRMFTKAAQQVKEASKALHLEVNAANNRIIEATRQRDRLSDQKLRADRIVEKLQELVG